MKFLFSLNVPSGGNDLVHQVVGEVPGVASLDILHTLMRDSPFVKIRLRYYTRVNGEKKWVDKGDMLLGTSHVAKVQTYID